MSEANQLATITESGVAAAIQQANLVQRVVRELMTVNTHFGQVPGVGKPFLWQPGAQKLALAFGLTPEYDMRETDLPGGHKEVVSVCRLRVRATGDLVGEYTASCSTMETKYRWRGAAGKPCPSCGENAMKRGKADFGGGYYCDRKLGGCGSNFKAGTPEAQTLDKVQTEGRLENPDIADTYNTVRAMSQKRAYVGCVRQATACSDMFDFKPDSLDRDDGGPRERSYKEPQRKGAPPQQRQQTPPPRDDGPPPGWDDAPPPDHREPPPQQRRDIITDAQRRRLFAIAKDRSIAHETLKTKLATWGISTTAEIPVDIYDALCQWAENGGYEPGQEPT